MKLLPASVDSLDLSQTSDVSTSLVPPAQRAIETRPSQISLVPSADAFAWLSSTRRGDANFIHGTPVADSQGNDYQGNEKSDRTGGSVWEYVSGWAWSRPVETAVAHYRSYAAIPANWRGRLIDLYA